MPKLERLEWIAPLSEGRGITLSNSPDADLFLAESSTALLLGVLYDSQYATRMAFAVPYKLRERLGHLDPAQLTAMDADELAEFFQRKPALHRFPRRFAGLTQQVCSVVVERYRGDPARIWTEAADVEDLARRILALPAFGTEKTNWTVGMLGLLGYLPFDGWENYGKGPDL